MTFGVTLLIALLSQSAASAAAEPLAPAPTRARLELRGAPDCISRADLASRVAARTSRVQFADDAAIFARVAVTSGRPGNVIADLVLALRGAEQPSRRVAARSCAEMADAIALIIAVTLDPTLKPPGADAGGATEGGGLGTGPPTEKSAEPVQTNQRPALPATVEVTPNPPVTSSVATRRQFAVSVAGQTIFGPAPSVMPGIALYGMAALDRDGVWAPALFVGATHVWRNDLAEPGGSASFTLDAATIDACPLRLGGTRVVARPCASALIGRLNASGANVEQAASVARPFASAGAALSVSAGTTVEVSARIGVGATLLRDSYDFTGPTFHRAAAVTTAVSLGVGFRWP